MQRVLVLGATSAIARALAYRLAREGAQLYLAARDAEAAERISADLSVRTGARAHAGAFDAADFRSHARLIRRAADALGGLDGVIVAFGALGGEERAQRDARAAVAAVNQNFTGAVSLLTLAAERLEAQGAGFVIVLGSVAGERGRARNYVYGAAKGALALYAQGLRARLARAGVHVLTVKLGPADTRMTWGRERVALAIAPEAAAARIHAAWRRRCDVVFVPAVWRLIMWGLRLVPERWFKRAGF